MRHDRDDAPATEDILTAALAERLLDWVALGGPPGEDYAEALDTFALLHASAGPHRLETLRAELLALGGDAFTGLDTMQGFALRKPRGHACDFELVERIHTRRVSQLYPRWDLFFHAQAGARSVRARPLYLDSLLRAVLIRDEVAGRTLRVLNLGSGPGCELAALDPGIAARLDVTCVEQDAEAISRARQVLARFPGRVRLIQCSPLRHADEGGYDLVWSGCLFDHLNDHVAVAVLGKARRLLAPGGEVVAGNFGEGNPSRPYMELASDWRLTHRTPSRLTGLAVGAGFAAEGVQVGADPERVSLFLHAGLPR